MSDDAEAVVVKIAESVGSSLDEFHLSVEAFGDAVVLGESPHGGDGAGPLREGVGESLQARQLAASQTGDEFEESAHMNAALSFGLGFEVEQGAELIAQLEQGFQRGMLLGQLPTPHRLLGTESCGGPAQAGQMASVPVNLRSDGADHLHEMSIDQAHDMEPVRDDSGVGEIATDQGTIRAAQIDADDLNLFAPFELSEVRLQFRGAATGHHVEDTVVLQIAEGRGEAVALMQRVLVQTEDLRTLQAQAFFGAAFGELSVATRDGGLAQAFFGCEGGRVDPRMMVLINPTTKRFGELSIRLDRR